MNIFDFDKKQNATPVVRPDDLVVLRVETRNMKIESGDDKKNDSRITSKLTGFKNDAKSNPPRLRKDKTGEDAYLILHFQPQSFAEETFFQSAPPNFTDPNDTSVEQPLPLPPVRARIADESRLVFIVPDDFNIKYSLASVLEACQHLPLKVSAAADGRRDFSRFSFSKLKYNIKVIDANVKATDNLQSFIRPQTAGAVANMFRIASTGDLATLRMRAGLSGDTGLIFEESKTKYPEVSLTNPEVSLTNPEGNKVSLFSPQPKQPDETTTPIEMPWRLILSPHSGGRWQHAEKPVRSSETNHTELWHSRLVVPDENNEWIEPPYPDEKRTTRAIWALSGEGNEGELTKMQSAWPNAAKRPGHYPNDNFPFLTTLDNCDRYQIAHLSSNFSKTGYTPNPLDTNMMMLSAMGGWLDSRGAWEPPDDFSVEEWVHRATMGRDHFVRVVYRGFLFPFGHRVSLVKVSERKFHAKINNNPIDGNPAYLRQRYFIIVREKERTFDEELFIKKAAKSDGSSFARKFPFSRVKILTETTPDLDNPAIGKSSIHGIGSQSMFWPHVGDNPFCFQCVATDLDGRRVFFELPMIFMENTLASPRDDKGVPDYGAAETNAGIASRSFKTKGEIYNTAKLNWQRVALALSVKSGDTAVQVETMTFGGFTESGNKSLQNYSEGLTRPIWAPQIEEIKARIEAIANLSGEQKSHTLKFNEEYLKKGFDPTPNTGNPGEVFVNVVEGPNLDFSSQGDKSGGFLQPNMKPKALSRLAGPIMSKVDDFIKGTMPSGAGFPDPTDPSTAIPNLPMPLIFGCIPLGAIIAPVSGIAQNMGRVPKFISEVSTMIESFFNNLDRLYGFVTDFPEQSASIAKGALDVFTDTLKDLKEQANVLPNIPSNNQRKIVQEAVNTTLTSIDEIINKLTKPSFPDWSNFHSRITAVCNAIENLREKVEALETVANDKYPVGNVNVFLPAGLKQSILNTVVKLTALLNQIKPLLELARTGKQLFDKLWAIIEPGKLEELFSNVDGLTELLGELRSAITGFHEALENAELLEGALRNAISAALEAAEKILGSGTDLAKLVENLIGDELTIHFDWNPEINSWPSNHPLFRANDKKGLVVAVEAKVKKSGGSSPSIRTNCSLKHFDLVLVAPASFIELNFEKIEFSVDSAAKMDVDVKFSDIKFVGVLSFVETLRDLIPLDGFSDPPYLDITSKGIDAGFSISLPAITCGVLTIANISLGAGFTVPFIGQPLSVRFNFCTRENPFLLTVYGLGGGGWFCITIDPHGVQVLEAGFEFGAALSVNLGVASGGVHIMAGIYYRMENDEASLTGYFRMGGNLCVLGLINASIELYLALTYEFSTGKCVGRASLTIGISILFFSTSVTISHERKFAGSNGDPTLRQMLGYNPDNDPDLTLDGELDLINENTEYAWRDYIEAFA